MPKKRMCLFLACVFFCACLFGGCSSVVNEQEPDTTASTAPLSTETERRDPPAVDYESGTPLGYLTKQAQPTEEQIGMSPYQVLCSGMLWMKSNQYGSSGREAGLYRMSPDGSDAEYIPLTWPAIEKRFLDTLAEDEEAIWFSDSLVACGEDIPYLLMQLTKVKWIKNAEGEIANIEYREVMQWALCRADRQGIVEIVTVLPLNDFPFNSFTAMYADEDLVWLAGDFPQEAQESHIIACALDDGSIRYDIIIPADKPVPSDLAVTGNGQLVVFARPLGRPASEDTIYLIDLTKDKPSIEHEFTLTSFRSAPQFVKWEYGKQPENGLWLWDRKGIFVWDLSEDKIIARYTSDGLSQNSYLWPVLGTDEDSFFFISGGNGEPVTVTTVDADISVDTGDRTLVTLANTGNAAVEDAANMFNAAQDAVYVNILDYSDSAAAAAGFASGTEMLQRALVQGGQIDIITVPNDLSGGLMDPALFLDLYPLIDADSELSRDDFVSGVLTACENGDALPTVVPQYNLLTAVGSAAKLGNTPGWSWAEYDSLTAGIPTPLYGFERATVLHYMVQMGGKSLLDYDAAAAHLDTPRFAQLLTRAKSYPESTVTYNTQDPKPQFATGKSLAIIRFVGDFSHIRTDVYNFDGPIVHKGFPTDDGGTGSAFTAVLRLGISANCADADAAWQFVRQFLLPTYQDRLQTNFPLRRDSLQKRAEATQQPLEYPSLPLYFNADTLTEKQQEYWMRAITAEEAQQLVDLIEATDTMFQFDAAVLNILGEESAAFFAGQTAAEAAAAIMQNRVQTYLDEQG